jgi:hypothetical protein
MQEPFPHEWLPSPHSPCQEDHSHPCSDLHRDYPCRWGIEDVLLDRNVYPKDRDEEYFGKERQGLRQSVDRDLGLLVE